MRRHLLQPFVLLAALTSAQQQPSPTFRGQTTLIEVEAVVTDKAGRFVADLTPADFELADQGRPVPIDAFYRVIRNLVQLPNNPPAADGIAPRLPAPETHRVFVLLFDSHMRPAELARARKAATSFLAADFREGDVGGVVVGGHLLRPGLSGNQKQLADAVAGVRPDLDVLAADAAFPQTAVSTDAETVRSAQAADEIAGELSRANDLISGSAAQWETEKSLRLLLGTVKALARVPGRKNVVFLSGGFEITGQMPGDTRGAGGPILREIVETAARESVRVYSIDTRGLDRGSADSSILAAEAPKTLGAPTLVRKNQPIVNDDVLSSLALDTGGLWIHNGNDFGRAFREVASDAGSYYVLGFRPQQSSDGRSFHTLRVRVGRPGVTVRARKGYRPPQ